MRTYQKEVRLILECRSQNQADATKTLNAVAHGLHSLGHPLTTGGKEKRVVSVDHKSRPIKHIPQRLLKS
ncbi:unnamed protein product [marine sediment metagenome]|uniref:Uncharacterized protein n=1 Tax=marine sediment metagenome TaxID=412755 RepID=X0V1R4_9ZZZZ